MKRFEDEFGVVRGEAEGGSLHGLYFLWRPLLFHETGGGVAFDALEDVADFVGEDVAEEDGGGAGRAGEGELEGIGEEGDAGASGGVRGGEGEG